MGVDGNYSAVAVTAWSMSRVTLIVLYNIVIALAVYATD